MISITIESKSKLQNWPRKKPYDARVCSRVATQSRAESWERAREEQMYFTYFNFIASHLLSATFLPFLLQPNPPDWTLDIEFSHICSSRSIPIISTKPLPSAPPTSSRSGAGSRAPHTRTLAPLSHFHHFPLATLLKAFFQIEYIYHWKQKLNFNMIRTVIGACCRLPAPLICSTKKLRALHNSQFNKWVLGEKRRNSRCTFKPEGCCIRCCRYLCERRPWMASRWINGANELKRRNSIN